jgi:hypothetical protein
MMMCRWLSGESSKFGGVLMHKNQVRFEVEKFRERTAYGNSNADCFPPWYLHQTFRISEAEAMRQSAEHSANEEGVRGYDFGIDAFHIERSEAQPRLIIVQAKYSNSLNYISKGFKDLEKCLLQLQAELVAVGSVVPLENKVLVNLRSDLNRLDPQIKKDLAIEFVVIHLCDEDREIIGNRTRTARESLKEALEEESSDRTCVIKDIGPREMGEQQDIVAHSPWIHLTVNSTSMPVSVGQTLMYYGVGFLVELVEIYRQRRDALFSKNVRYFINRKSNIEKGAAGKMKQTLKQICAESNLEPEIFALYHNGITLFAREVQPDGKEIKVREPYVLNGCQTIKNAYLYFYNPRNRAKINEENWKRILVPLRILCTKDEDMTRAVTINNNRQNAISFAALRANDPIQIQLEERFKKTKIFYERQEGAYASLEDASPETIEDEYENTRGRQVNIVDLARAIAAAAGEISYAKHPGDIFESDVAYARVFSAKRLSSLTLLTFLQNLNDVIPLVLKKDLDLQQEGKGPKPGGLGYYAMCLLTRYLAKQNDEAIIQEFGGELWGRSEQFRFKVAQLLDNYHSGIKRGLKEKFLTLDDSTGESLNDAFARAEASLHLRNSIDVFEIFKNLDQKS